MSIGRSSGKKEPQEEELMRLNSLVVACLLSLLAGCLVDVPDLETATFACTVPEDCASGYTCVASIGQCAKTCTVAGDCPTTAPNCVDGACIEPCAAKNCGATGQVCVIEANGAVCKPCAQANHDCQDPALACVVKDPAGTSLCVPKACPNGLGGACPVDGSTGRCVSVRRSKDAVGELVCVPCPASCAGACVPSPTVL